MPGDEQQGALPEPLPWAGFGTNKGGPAALSCPAQALVAHRAPGNAGALPGSSQTSGLGMGGARESSLWEDEGLDHGRGHCRTREKSVREKFIFTGRQSGFGKQALGNRGLGAVGKGLFTYRENWMKIWGSVWFSSA